MRAPLTGAREAFTPHVGAGREREERRYSSRNWESSGGLHLSEEEAAVRPLAIWRGPIFRDRRASRPIAACLR